jgi:gliding motility-associated-like protein
MSGYNGQTISTCSGSLSVGSYSVGQTLTVTVCSNDPINRFVRLFISSYSFPNGTSLTVYDGPNTSAPVLEVYNHTTTSGTLSVVASNINESGCLTFVFVGNVSGGSFSGTLSCEFQCMPRQVYITASDPPLVNEGGIDYINVCWDEDNNTSFPVTFTANGVYPNPGYPLNDGTVTFTWNFQDGSPIQSGVGLNEVTHTFPDRRGYVVIVTITDQQNCTNTNAVAQRVRVSRAPIWNTQTTTLSPTAICMGQTVNMCGYYSSSTWNSSVVPAVADTIPLPDGTGVCYNSPLMQNQFNPGQTVTSINDIIGIHMNMCHTYIGDLTFYIQCPNGTIVQMGIQGGGGCDLGNPPNQGWWYTISPTGTQTMQQAAVGHSVLPAGTYASYQSLAGLIGCPLNGTWTIRICDNWAIDSGTLFGWWIEFNPSLFPELWSYTNTYTPTSWQGVYGSQMNPPTNQNCATGTYTTTGTPDINSQQPFTFTITDNFGCTHDTTLTVLVRHMNDPNCCILPNPNAGPDNAVCALTYTLNASNPAPNNTVEWTLVSGPGTASFANQTSNVTDVTVSMYGTYTFRITERYLGNSGCQRSDDVVITFNPTYVPTLSPVDNMCVGSMPVQLYAPNFGTLTCSPNPQLLDQNSAIFSPNLPGNYTITNTVNDPCTGGPVTSQINFSVYDQINIQNFEEVCGPTGSPTLFYVSWDVVGSQGNPFSGYLVNGVSQANPHFQATIESPNSYNYTVTDANGCSSFELNGFRDCGCPFYAGTMGTLSTIILCGNECTSPNVTHNGDENTDGGSGIFEFMIHTGNNIPIARNSTPNFCRLPLGLDYNTIYYVSAIVGLNDGSGHANISSGCYHISQGTPVMWLEMPYANAGTDKDTCGLMIRLNANTPVTGMYGYWTSSCSNFVTIGGTNYTQPNPIVLVPDYQDCTFTWNIANGQCISSDDVVIRFLRTPTPFAGDDFTVCGNSTIMQGVASVTGTNLSWSGSGTIFNPQTSANAEARISVFGTYEYTLTESISGCSGSDKVLVTYVPEPNPTTTPGTDTVCGTSTILTVYNSSGAGQWTALNPTTETPITPQPTFTPNINSPVVTVSIGNYTGNYTEILFRWQETTQLNGVQCTGTVDKKVRFARMPVASVGSVNEAERCGNCVELQADVTGSQWAEGMWIVGKVIPESWSPSQFEPTTTLCIKEIGSYGDTAHVRVPVGWALYNPDARACQSVDTMWVTFYRRPQANAGLDNAVCGNNYTLGAVYSLPQTSGYNPSGLWSVYSRPNVTPTPSATFANLNNDTTLVTVSNTGFWEFVFRENNTYLSSCYSTDTVKIEFVEIPIISAGPDKHVCGQCTQLEGTTAGYNMSWTDNGAQYSDYSIPNPDVCVNTYGPREFVMIETNMSQPPFTLACQAKDTVIITFWRVPTANILTDEADSTVCGLTFPRLRAENPGTGIRGYWSTNNPFTQFSPNAYTWNNASATVPSYGYHDFYWIEETGPEDMPGFCTDTAGPLRIHFIQIPTANAGNDTLFCGFSGTLNAIPSIGTGVWSTPSTQNISFSNANNPNATVTSNILNAGNPANPYFLLIWTEDNTNGCTDKDTIKVQFARIPSSDVIIIPPKCFGEEATIRAVEDTLQQYTWNFFNGQVVQSFTNSQGGNHRNFVRWNDGRDSHVFNLITTNYWGCNSPIAIDTVYEPPIPEFDVNIIKDTCALGKGGIIFNENSPNTAFFWIYDTVGPAPGPITQVLNIPAGDYGIRTSYLTPNTQYISHYLSTFGTQYCIDTFYYTIQTVGMIDAQMEIAASVDLENLVAPNAVVTFLNNSIYDDVRKRCEWNFGDGTKLKNCDPMVEHTYTKSGCYEPFLIVMNRDLPECRDTARLEACIQIDDESMIEVPNIFSPNGDGTNDFFQVKARTLKTFKGQIVNRWGRVVYEWENWQDYEAGWDGNLEGGTKAAPGVYYYIIIATGWDDKDYNIQGALHLMR